MPILDRYDIASKLKDLRKRRGCTQEYVAKAIGIGRPAYGSYEEGRAEPSIPVMLRLVKFYHLESIDHMLGEKFTVADDDLNSIVKAYLRLRPEMRKVVDFILKQNNNAAGDTEH